MKIITKVALRATKKLLSGICAALFISTSFAQIKTTTPATTYQRRSVIADTVPRRYHRADAVAMTADRGLQNTVDTSYSAEPFLISKKDCAFEKTIDNAGCVVIKYTDGLIKKMCGGYVTEVITPDKKRHIIRVMVIQQLVMKIHPPANPAKTDNAFNWLTFYSNNLLKEIEKDINNTNLFNQYTSRENALCGDNIYKAIEYRTIFLEEFLGAK